MSSCYIILSPIFDRRTSSKPGEFVSEEVIFRLDYPGIFIFILVSITLVLNYIPHQYHISKRHNNLSLFINQTNITRNFLFYMGSIMLENRYKMVFFLGRLEVYSQAQIHHLDCRQYIYLLLVNYYSYMINVFANHRCTIICDDDCNDEHVERGILWSRLLLANRMTTINTIIDTIGI